MSVRVISQNRLPAMDVAKAIADSIGMTMRNEDRDADSVALWGEANGNQMAIFVEIAKDMAITAVLKGPEVVTMATIFTSLEVE